MNDYLSKSGFLRTSRNFPTEALQLSIELNRSYVDIAHNVNARVIGFFTVNRSTVTGENWYIEKNQKQQTLRQVYTFGPIAPGTELDIPHGIKNFDQFTRIYGTVVTTTPGDYRPLPYIDPGSLTTGMTVLVGIVATVPSIRIVLGATALPVSKGLVVLEWLALP